jgi:hypothetical protein
MKGKAPRDSLLVILMLVYSLAVMSWGLLRDPLAPDEAQAVFMGRGIVASGSLQCPALATSGGESNALDEKTCAYPGSAAIAPLLISVADSMAGIHGARLVGVFLGLILIVLVYRIGNSPPYGKRGVLTAATFVFLGIPLQLSSHANADAYTAVFFAASLLLAGEAAGASTGRQRRWMLVVSALSLSLATMTHYFTALFVIPVALFVVLRQRFAAAGLFFLLPLLAMVSLYGYVMVLPAWYNLKIASAASPMSVDVMPPLDFAYVFEWLAMPYLLATFGIFHREGGKEAFFLMLLAAPSFLIHVITPDIRATHTAVLLSLIVLAPAAAQGVSHMGDLFSSHNPMALVKPFFITAVLAVIWVFGLQQIKGLKQENPDLSPVAAFLGQKGYTGMTVLVDSDYGSPEYVYRLLLEDTFPSARVVAVTRGSEKERKEIVADMHPDYVVIDDHHSDRSFNRAAIEYLAQGFTVARTFQVSLASGIKNVKIFEKGAL